MSSANKNNFILSNWYAFYFLIVLAKISSSVWKRSGERRQLCFRRKVSSFLRLNMLLGKRDFFVHVLYQVEEILLYS